MLLAWLIRLSPLIIYTLPRMLQIQLTCNNGLILNYKGKKYFKTAVQSPGFIVLLKSSIKPPVFKIGQMSNQKTLLFLVIIPLDLSVKSSKINKKKIFVLDPQNKTKSLQSRYPQNQLTKALHQSSAAPCSVLQPKTLLRRAFRRRACNFRRLN